MISTESSQLVEFKNWISMICEWIIQIIFENSIYRFNENIHLKRTIYVQIKVLLGTIVPSSDWITESFENQISVICHQIIQSNSLTEFDSSIRKLDIENKEVKIFSELWIFCICSPHKAIM